MAAPNSLDETTAYAYEYFCSSTLRSVTGAISEVVARPKLSLAPKSVILFDTAVGDLTPLPMVVVASYYLDIVEVAWLKATPLPELGPARYREVERDEFVVVGSIAAGKIVTATFSRRSQI